MKLLLIFIAGAAITLAKTSPLPICNTDTAKLALPPRIFYEQTIDTNRQPILLTRLIHNKLGVYGSEFAHCYVSLFDFNFIYNNFSLIGLVTFLVFMYEVLTKKRYLLAAIIFLSPLIPFFKGPIIINLVIYKLFAIIGLIFLFKKFK